MADVFISYSHHDSGRIPVIADSLRALGLTVWYDIRLQAGESFDETIEAELEAAKAIMICWSAHSVKSKWVKSEASVADDQGTMVACRLDDCKLPQPYNIIHTENLTGWTGDGDFHAWRKIIERIGTLVERPGLLPLLDAKTSGDPVRMAVWAQEYPDDVSANASLETWRVQERQSFTAQMADVREKVDAYFRSQQSRAKSRLSKTETAFDAWLAGGIKSDGDIKPNPTQILSDVLKGAGADEIAALRDAAASAETRARIADETVASLAAENKALQDAVTGSADAPRRTSPLVLAGVAALGLAGGFFASKALVDPGQMARQQIEDAATRMRVADLRANEADKKTSGLEGGLAAAQQQVQALQAEAVATAQKLAVAEAQARNAELARMEANRKLDEAVAAQKRDFGMTSAPQQVSSAPATSTSISNAGAAARSMEICTRNAGSKFDTDNASKDGPADTASLSDEVIRTTIQACQSAAQQINDSTGKRRALAQLGRVQAAQAVSLAKGGLGAQARQLMQSAVGSWMTAANLKSAIAMNFLGAYFDGSYSREVNRADSDYFVQRDQATAITWWRSAADAGNPTAMSNMAAMMLDPKSRLVNFDAYMADRYLEAAMSQGLPRAFINKASGVINGHLEPHLSIEAKRRKAAQLVERAACLGDRTNADLFFTRDFPYMAAYRPSQYSC